MNYKKLDQDDLKYINSVINDSERVLYGEDINEEYSHDELSDTKSYPDVVVKIMSTDEISQIMKYAYDNNILYVLYFSFLFFKKIYNF